jgi:Putative beta-barrel porin-2, OmpL-like. bbp2
MKSVIKLVGFSALLAAAAATVQAEVKINENLTIDGYAIGSGVITEGTPTTNNTILGKSGGAFDSLFVGVNGKYNDLSARVSFMAVNPFDNTPGDNSGVLDAYVTYSMGEVSITAGKYLGYLGFESFHSPNNAFISFSQLTYASPFATGVKLDYTGDGFSAGISARDSQMVGGTGFNTGDGEYSKDIGYEAFFSYTGIKDLTLFFGAGYENVDGLDNQLEGDFWFSYNVTDKLSLAGEVTSREDAADISWLGQVGYKLTDELSLAARLTYIDTKVGDTVAYGLASTYTFTKNFSLKGEVTHTDSNSGGPEVAQYALQGLFRF